jgi:anti-anti-sigma regulatory factor
MREVPLIDATALSALETLMSDCRKNDCRLIISGLQQRPRHAMHRMGLLRRYKVILTADSAMAIDKARVVVAQKSAKQA